MPRSHRRHGQDKTVLSSPCRRCEVNWRQVKTVGDRKFRNWTYLVFWSFIQSGNAMWTVFVCKRVYTADGTGQNCPVSNILRTTENCRRLSPTLFTPPTRQVLSCPCRRCELGIDVLNRRDVMFFTSLLLCPSRDSLSSFLGVWQMNPFIVPHCLRCGSFLVL